MMPAAAAALARVSHEAGAALREARLRRRWTMRHLSEHAGVAVGSIQAIESGGVATLETYARLATALGLRPSLALDAGRAAPKSRHSDAEDFVHAAMGECEVGVLRRPGLTVAIDEPYQHYQFAGRADVLAWADRDLLHVENRTRFPNLQEAAGAYNAKRQYLAATLGERLGIGPAGWRSVTHVMACLWSSEVLHVLRLRAATFASLCPAGPEGFEAWLRGTPPPRGVSSTLVLLDPWCPSAAGAGPSPRSTTRSAPSPGIAATPRRRRRFGGRPGSDEPSHFVLNERLDRHRAPWGGCIACLGAETVPRSRGQEPVVRRGREAADRERPQRWPRSSAGRPVVARCSFGTKRDGRRPGGYCGDEGSGDGGCCRGGTHPFGRLEVDARRPARGEFGRVRITVPRGIATLLGREGLVLAGVGIAGRLLTFGLRAAGGAETAVFIVAAITLAGLAGLVGLGTDQLGSRFGPGATGVLQSALGNLPELFISLFALREGLVVLTQTALVGSILGNSLLVLGLAFLAGGLKHGRQVFDAGPVRTIAVILVLAVAALAIPTVSTLPGEFDQGHAVEISVFVSVVLLVVFVASIPYSLGGGRGASKLEVTVERPWPTSLVVGVLAASGIGAAVMSDWFVEALRPAMASLGLSEAFVGLVVVALAGNAVENVTGIQQAMRNRPDLAISLIQNSSLQVAIALTPVLVLAQPRRVPGADDAGPDADAARRASR